MSDGGAECLLAFEECYSALGHAMALMPWWADSSRFSNACFAFSCFLKNIFFVYNQETLSYSATNSLNLFKTLLGIDVAYIDDLSCNKSLHQG